MDKKVWKVAVIGCSNFAFGQYFTEIPKEANAICVAAVDPDIKRAELAKEKFNIPNVYKDVYELIENCDFDIAIDASAIQAHHEINMAILGAGKHLISQKPAAPNLEMMKKQVALAKEKGVLFACAPIHPMRFDIHVAKQWMKDGVIGRPYYAKINLSHGGPEYFQYRDTNPSWFFEKGAGALVDMGVHGLQIATTLLGPARSVACTAILSTPIRTIRSGALDGVKINADKIPDQYLITLEFDDNKMALVDTGFSQKASKCPQIEIFGDEGTISFTKPYMQNPMPELYLDCVERGVRGWVNADSGTKIPDKLNSQCCILKDMVNALETGEPLQLSANHAMHLIEIMDKIPLAIEKGCKIKLETEF